MLLNVAQYNSDLFFHNPQNKTLIADISDLQWNRFDQLHDDACDVGIALRNSKTGNVTRWVLIEELRDKKENELTGWVLRPIDSDIRRQPVLAGYTMTLLND